MMKAAERVAPRRFGTRGNSGVAVLAVAVLLAVTAVACSTDKKGQSSHAVGANSSSSDAADTQTTLARPSGPAASIAGPLTGGKGILLATATPPGPALDAAGYSEAEYTAAGTATSYTSSGDLPTNGTYALQPGPTADYVTRIVVRRPKESRAFNGTVAVEWLNVSAGFDGGPDYTYLEAELLRKGYAWVGVSAQRIGIEGGTVAVKAPGGEAAGAGKGLRNVDPERYERLHHPGDAFAYDIYTQVARALRSPGATNPLDRLKVRNVLAIGESQSAFALTTYYDGVQPLTHSFDGFLIHSRGGAPAPLGTPGGFIDIAGSILFGHPTTLRTDQAAPAMVVETETDVLGLIGYYPARQPDDEHLRVWEVAGTSHADAFQIGKLEPTLGCAQPINRGQQVFVLRAALRHLQAWITKGTPPPHATPLEVRTSSAKPTFVLDDVGNVKGGVRTPAVDAPVDVLSGLSPGTPSVICLLLGTTTPIPAAHLAALYPTKDAYLQRYTTATDAAISAGFALTEDRKTMLDGADPSRIAG